MEIRKRYWLDGQFDVSAVYVGEEANYFLFSDKKAEPDGFDHYLENDKGYTPMPRSGYYVEYGKEQHGISKS